MSKGYSNLIRMTRAANAALLTAERLNPNDVRVSGREYEIDRLFSDLKKSCVLVFRLTPKCLQFAIPASRRAEFDAKGEKWVFEYRPHP